MNRQVQKEVEDLIQKLNLGCSVQDFQDKVDWFDISHYQKLSESFIREFQNKVYWPVISRYQKLSEEFEREFASFLGSNVVSENLPEKEPKNNDGRDECFWCKSKTKQVQSIFSVYNVCKVCGR